MGRGVSSVLRPALLFFDDYSVSVGGYAEDIGEIKRSSAGIDGFGFERNVVEVYADDGIAAKIVSCLLELFHRLRIAGIDVKHQVGVFAGTRGLRFALGEQPGHVIIQSDVSASLSCHVIFLERIFRPTVAAYGGLSRVANSFLPHLSQVISFIMIPLVGN